MAVLVTACSRIGYDTREELVVSSVPLARLTMTCCGASLSGSPDFIAALAEIIEQGHECALLPLSAVSA